MVRSRHKADASHDVKMGTPAPSEGGEPLTPQSQPSVQFNAPVASRETAAVDGLENAPRSLHESAQQIDTEGVNWKAISEETKEFYWKEFKKKCCWESFEEAGIKAAWRSKVQGHDCRFKEFQEKALQHWNDPKVIQRSEIYSRNSRGAANAHGLSTHTSGSITYAEWSDKLDAIAARREELTQTTPGNIDENQLYLDVVGGGEKRRKKQLEDERQAMTERMDQMKLEMEMNMECMRSFMMEEMMRLVRDLPTSLPPPPQN
ncbi:hypothetical protein P3X46_021707 [Hevea brasiliensis]|uniref:No apical meristem-associated C-terminal domain-containing protein n=1 Tax=Hevea brasiliensis TaxID=3981 RepID=A0ABQ9LIB3_HEVBR|nr:hypothetical protein P3X46_021707 [Hevea brasiliensis]